MRYLKGAFLIFLWMGTFLISSACEKSENTIQISEKTETGSDVTSSGMPENHPPITPGTVPDISPIRGDHPTIIPDDVKGQWKAVRLQIDNKLAKTSMEYEVNLNTDWVVPDSDLVLQVGHFLPDLKIENSSFTSATPELNNPAVHVVVLEKGTPIFNGWLFSLFPTIHPFQHEQFRILLKEGVRSS